MVKLSFIILTLKQYQMARKCITSLKKTLDVEGNHEFILVSQEHEDKYDKMFKDCILVKIKENLGYAKANNIGSKYATGDYMVILNDDFYFRKPIFKKLLEVYEQIDRVGNVAPLIYDHLHNFHWSYSLLDMNTGEPIIRTAETGILELEYGEYCPPFLISRKAWDEVGGFDERYYPFNYEDADFCAKLRLYNYRVLVRNDVMVDHLGSQTVLKIWYKDEVRKYHTLNKERFRAKWGRFNV